MSSGVAVNDECVETYTQLKLGHSLRFITYKITDDFTQIVVDKKAAPTSTFDEFVAELPSNECRYGVFDFEWDAEEGRRNKILFVLWAPDSAKVKQKMIYTSSKDGIRKKFVGIGTEIQATDKSEIDHSAVLEKVNRK